MANLDDHYPLHKPNDDILRRLGIELWGWQLCNKCMNKPVCEDDDCPWSRRQDLENVWKHYNELTTSYIPGTTSAMVLNSHDKFLSIMKAIKEYPGWTRTELMAHCFPRATGQDQGVIVQIDQTRAVDMAATVVFFIDCDCAGSPLTNVDPFRWRPSVRIGDFLKDALRPTTTSSMLYAVTGYTKSRLRRTFSAANLRNNITGLHFEPTEDLRCHLRFDPRSRALQVFQHTAAMKEVLLSKPANLNACAIPRALALEVCDTIYNVLFPNEVASQSILSHLIRKRGFDRDLKDWDAVSHQMDVEYDDAHPYFGHRLAILLEEMKDPSPSNWFERRFDKGTRSVERRMFMATMIGVFITAISSVLSLIVSCYQAYNGYQQLKDQR